MQSCSVHHCVLFLLTLTFTTDPGSAASVVPLYAKLHQSVTLPCEAQCSPKKAKWSLENNREVVFARCDQTSCTSVKQGYEMSHDQYKSGDLSLIITNPVYSMRESYTCECDYSDYVTWRLRIFTVSSAVQMETEGDLKLNLSVPESVEVIYRGSDSADGVQICTVTDRTLQCNTEYTPRTSLSNSELTLRDVQRSESGTYTIRNLDYKEDIRVYAVSVSGLTSGETAGIVISVLLLLAVLAIAGVMYYRKKEAEWEVKPLKDEVQKHISEGKVKDTPGLLTLANLIGINPHLKNVMEKVKEVEVVRDEAVKEIIDLEAKYREDSKYSKYVRWFCNEKRDDLGLFTNSTMETPTLSPESEREQFNLELEKVNTAVEKVMEALKKARRAIDDLEKKYRGDETNKRYVTWFCNNKRIDLGLWSDLTRDSIPAWEIKPTGEMVMKVLPQEEEEEINPLEQKYSGDRVYPEQIIPFCNNKREELEEFRNMFGDLGDVKTEEVKSELEAVIDLMDQAVIKPPVEMMKVLQRVEEKIKALEQKYRDDSEYSEYVTSFCNSKKEETELCRKIFGQGLGDVQTKEFILVLVKVNRAVEKALKPLEKARKAINDLEQKYREDDTNKRFVTRYCNEKLRDLGLWKDLNTDSVPTWGQQPQSVAVNMETPETQKNADRGEREPLNTQHDT